MVGPSMLRSFPLVIMTLTPSQSIAVDIGRSIGGAVAWLSYVGFGAGNCNMDGGFKSEVEQLA